MLSKFLIDPTSLGHSFSWLGVGGPGEDLENTLNCSEEILTLTLIISLSLSLSPPSISLYYGLSISWSLFSQSLGFSLSSSLLNRAYGSCHLSHLTRLASSFYWQRISSHSHEALISLGNISSLSGARDLDRGSTSGLDRSVLQPSRVIAINFQVPHRHPRTSLQNIWVTPQFLSIHLLEAGIISASPPQPAKPYRRPRKRRSVACDITRLVSAVLGTSITAPTVRYRDHPACQPWNDTRWAVQFVGYLKPVSQDSTYLSSGRCVLRCNMATLWEQYRRHGWLSKRGINTGDDNPLSLQHQ